MERRSIATFFSAQYKFLPLIALFNVAPETGMTKKLAVPGISGSLEGAPLGW
jgi:hypothetical protein